MPLALITLAAQVMLVLLIACASPLTTPANGAAFEIYDVSDLLYRIHDFKSNHIAPKGSALANRTVDFQFARQGVLLLLSSAMVLPDTLWNRHSDVELHRGQLLVTASPTTHARLASLLDNLRQSPDLWAALGDR